MLSIYSLKRSTSNYQLNYDFVKKRQSYRLCNMAAYHFFSINNDQAENAIQCSKTGYHVTANDATVTF